MKNNEESMTGNPESTSSIVPGKSVQSADVISLGKRLSEELGREKEYDTLSKWIANLLAEKIVASEAASDAEEKERLQRQTVDLTLKIWNERYCAPPCIRPFQKIEKAISYLAERKDREDSPLVAFRSHRQDKDALSRLSDAFDAMQQRAVSLLALTPLALLAGSDPIEWEKQNKEMLEGYELKVIDLVRQWVSILEDTRSWETDWTAVKEMSQEQRILRVIARLEDGLNQVRQALQEFKLEVCGDNRPENGQTQLN